MKILITGGAGFIGSAVVRRAISDGHQVVNLDVTVVCEAPRVGPYVDRMRERLAGALGIAPRLVSVKGKTNEGMGWIGRGEGIAAIAVALVDAVGE